MSPEPRHDVDYSSRQVKAARKVLVDLGQVLASFVDCLVVVGGWAPDLLFKDVEEAHIGSMDVDMVLDASKLSDGRYAALLKLMLETRRYKAGEKEFQLVTEVNLEDGDKPVQVEVEFIAPVDVKLERNKPKLIEGFRVLQVSGSEVAFRAPVEVELHGENVRGALNTVHLRVISLSDYLIMKALAIGGRDKPKDAYDLCYCLRNCPEMETLAADWKERETEIEVGKAKRILHEKFRSVDAYGPRQLAEFHSLTDKVGQDIEARRAFELVQKFLNLLK